VGSGTEVIGIGDRGEKLVKDMGMIGGDGTEKEESAWAESSATENSRLPPVRPPPRGFVMAGQATG